MDISNISTERLNIRCYKDSDAPLMKEALDNSIEHLKPWLERAQNEPETLEKKQERIKRYQDSFQSGKEWNFGIFEKDNSKQLGAIGLHPRIGEGGVEVGYWIRPSHQGKGLVTEAVKALLSVALEDLGFEYIELHTRFDNVRSARIPQKLHFSQNRTISKKTGERIVWVLKKEDYGKEDTVKFR